MAEHGKTILVVDDEPIVLTVISRMLTAGGFDVLAAENGRNALERFSSEGPELVLCDLRLPDIDGLEVLSRIAEISPETPFVLMSGVGQLDDAIEAIKLGVWQYLVKPIPSATALLSAVHGALDRSELRRQNEAYRAELERSNADLSQSVVRLEREIREHQVTYQELLAAQKRSKSLARQLAVSEEKERRRIALDLHDDVAQVLAMSQLRLNMLRETSSSDEVRTALGQIASDLNRVIESIRSLTFDLSPPALADLGLGAALAELAQQIETEHGIATHVIEGDVPTQLETGDLAIIYRAARELMVNVVKHARARNMRIFVGLVGPDGTRLRVDVEDDGIGLDASKLAAPERLTRSTGLRRARERLNNLGGDLRIDRLPEGGTRATLLAALGDRPTELRLSPTKAVPQDNRI